MTRAPALLEDGPVRLPDGGDAERLLVERGEDLIDRLAQLGFECDLDLRERPRRQVVRNGWNMS